MIQDRIGRGFLGLEGKLGTALLGDQRDHIGIYTKSGTGNLQIVGADHVHILFGKLSLTVFQHILRFHGETADHLTG